MLGEDVIVSINSQIYVGTVSLVTGRYIKINGFEPKTSKPFLLKFYKNETFLIEPLQQINQISEQEPCNFSLQDFKLLSKMMKDVKFIKSFDRTYYDAIEDIEMEPFIGLCMPGVQSRFSSISVIAISTCNAIYIFDIMTLGRIEKDLKKILESEFTKKIIHDSCHVADYLKQKHEITLNGVFDTMVAHCSLGFDKSRFDLNQCLHDHFKLLEDFLDTDTVQWHRRPLSSNAKRIAALNVAFLKKLHSRLTRLMIKDLLIN